ncbi:hypothetical protein QP222_04125 [Corynebacterium pyruviciproducens]|uniref:hypothetical protein n=1 Tax=Corynebacterium pyruviciproducens TaxID=598660 RepID=UPI00254D9A78|nr:hypothetical protein [Corynebacterium pyruviciproducens]MDK6565600.1 hypothetical protein [Corynebacterium pyruviciproducens]
MEQGGLIFTRGMSSAGRAKISRLNTNGALIKLGRGVYHDAEEFHLLLPSEQYRLRCLAAGIAGYEVVGVSAAALWGLPVSHIYSRVDVRGKPRVAPGLLRRAVPPECVIKKGIDGFEIPLTTPAATVADIARWYDMHEAVRVGDAAVIRRLTTIQALHEEEKRRYRRHGSPKMRQALRLINGLSESLRESDVKVALFRGGFPPPQQQTEIYDVRMVFIGRPDFLYPERSLALEYDGWNKTHGYYGNTADRAINLERARERRLVSEGINLIRITKDTYASGVWLDELKAMWNRGVPFPQSQLRGGGPAW